MKKAIIAGVASGALLLGGAGIAQAAPTGSSVQGAVVTKVEPKKFKNCTAMNKVFKGGIAKKKSAKNMKTVSGKKVKANSRYKPKVSAKWYRLNQGLDRDKDRIACER